MIGSGFARFCSLLLWASAFIVFTVPQTHAQISAAPSALGFGNVLVGAKRSQTVTITNTSTRATSVSRAGISGTGFSMSGLSFPLSLAAGAKAVVSVTFAPPSAASDTGSVWFTTSSSGRHYRRRTTSVSLTGAGVATTSQVTASPTALSFGTLSMGQSKSLSVTVANAGSSNVTLSGASVSSGAFAISGLTLPASVSAGHSVTFSVVFKPTTSGTASGQLAIASNASNPQLKVALSGSVASTGQLSLAPATLNFGTVATGSTATLSGTLTATGSPVTVSSITSSSTEFVVSGVTLPIVLAAGKSATFTVTFHPQASGTATASLSFASNAASPITEALTGSGKAAAQHMVSLSWKPSASSGVVGYNLYRSNTSGGPYTQLSSRDSIPSYSDTSVTGGKTYFYVVTAVDGSGTESANSNQAQAVVPTP